MVAKPFKVKSSSSEHFERSRLETGVGGPRTITGGELCAIHLFNNKTVQNNMHNNQTGSSMDSAHLKSPLDKDLSRTSIFVILILIAVGMFYLTKKIEGPASPTATVQQQNPPAPVTPPTAEELAEKAKQDKIAEDKIKADQAKYLQSPAGRLCQKNPSWSKVDCDRLINREVWVGMTTGMLKYQRGNPNYINPSDYGNGVKYQYCWSNYKPSCFYDDNADGVLDSYN